MNNPSPLATRFASVKAELDEIKKIANDPETTGPGKVYLVQRCIELSSEIANIALEKMKQ